MFQEGAYADPGVDCSDMDGLKSYLMAQALLDPYADHHAVIARYLDAFYGPAAPFVREYMDTMHGSIADTSFYMVRLFSGSCRVRFRSVLLCLS